MARADNKTVRFTQVVEHSGEPRVHTLWLPPDKDPELQRAKKGNRVMTVGPAAAGGKTDIGTVGLKVTAGKRAQFLVFPKSLKRFEGARVVGIKFDLVSQPKLDAVDPLKHAGTPPTRRKSQKSPAPLARARKRAATAKASEPAALASEEEETETPTVVPFEPPPRVHLEEVSTTPPERSRPAARSSRHTDKPPAARGSPTPTALVREIRAAMKDLERGKSVAAYQRLERAVAKVPK